MNDNKVLDYIQKNFRSKEYFTSNVIVYVCLIISALYTILLFKSQAYTTLSENIQTAFAIMLELVKYNAPVIAIVGIFCGIKFPWYLRVIALIIAGFCFYYSYNATKGFQLIEVNNKNEYEYKNTDEYKKYENQKKIISDQIEFNKNQINILSSSLENIINGDKINNDQNIELKKQYQSDIANWQKQINSKNIELQECINKEANGQSMINTKKKLNDEIAQLKKNIDNTTSAINVLENINNTETTQNNIQQLTQTNMKLTEQFNNLKFDPSTINININTKKGYSVLFDSEQELNDFFHNLAVLLEVIGIYFRLVVGWIKSGGSSDTYGIYDMTKHMVRSGMKKIRGFSKNNENSIRNVTTNNINYNNSNNKDLEIGTSFFTKLFKGLNFKNNKNERKIGFKYEIDNNNKIEDEKIRDRTNNDIPRSDNIDNKIKIEELYNSISNKDLLKFIDKAYEYVGDGDNYKVIPLPGYKKLDEILKIKTYGIINLLTHLGICKVKKMNGFKNKSNTFFIVPKSKALEKIRNFKH